MNRALRILLIVLLVLLIVGLLPAWPYTAPYGYWPSGFGLLLLIVLLLIFFGRL